jgi:hypothetical protein
MAPRKKEEYDPELKLYVTKKGDSVRLFFRAVKSVSEIPENAILCWNWYGNVLSPPFRYKSGSSLHDSWLRFLVENKKLGILRDNARDIYEKWIKENSY